MAEEGRWRIKHALGDGIKANDIAAIVRAVGAGASATAPINEHGYTPLHRAAMLGNVEAMQCLVEQGVDVNTTDGNGFTALHMAANSGKIAARAVV